LNNSAIFCLRLPLLLKANRQDNEQTIERINEILKSSFTQRRNFQFRSLQELTAFVIEQGRIFYPPSFRHSYGYLSLNYLCDDPEDKQVAEIIRDSDFTFQEITGNYLEQIRNGDIRRPFSTETGDEQFFYYNGKKEKLCLINQMLE
jgi:hypothetical protein